MEERQGSLMCALLVMAVFDTEQNDRSKYTAQTLECLAETVDWNKHRLVVVDNASCQDTKVLLENYSVPIKIITNETNLGTAKAVNMGIKLRRPGEHCVKLDNDIRIHQSDWVDEMEEAIGRDPNIGVLGLKRKDLRQTPFDPDEDFRSELIQLPHESGQRWIIVEKSRDVMGTCTMLNWRLLYKIGGYVQYGIYGFDDTLLNLRSILSGFYNAFLPHIEITHLDVGGDYTQEKQQLAAVAWPEYHKLHAGFISGQIPLKVEI